MQGTSDISYLALNYLSAEPSLNAGRKGWKGFELLTQLSWCHESTRRTSDKQSKAAEAFLALMSHSFNLDDSRSARALGSVRGVLRHSVGTSIDGYIVEE